MTDEEPKVTTEEPKAAEEQPVNVVSEDDLAALKLRLTAAEQREREHVQRLEQLNKDAMDSRTAEQRAIEERIYAQEVAVSNAIAAATTDAQRLEQEIERLMAAGDAAGAAKAMRELSRADTKLAEAERNKEWVEQQRTGYQTAVEAEKVRAAEMARRPPPPQVSPKSQAWINTHPRMTTDDAYRNAAIGAHNLALLKGIPVDSDGYFEFIETQLGERQMTQVDADEPKEPTRIVSAPPSRSTPTAQRQNERRMTLTPQEREMADITMSRYPPDERYKRYAENKRRMLTENPIQ